MPEVTAAVRADDPEGRWTRGGVMLGAPDSVIRSVRSLFGITEGTHSRRRLAGNDHAFIPAEPGTFGGTADRN